MKHLKKTCFLLASVLLLNACNKTNDLTNNASKTSGSWYSSHWFMDGGKDVYVECLVDGTEIINFIMDGQISHLLEMKSYVWHYDQADALRQFDDCIKLGYDCVRLERFDRSPASTINQQAETAWLVVYGHYNEKGDCDWAALESVLNND